MLTLGLEAFAHLWFDSHLIYTYGHVALQPINSWCNNNLEIGEKNLSWLCTKFEWKENFSPGWLIKTTTNNNTYLMVIRAVVLIHNRDSQEIERLKPGVLTTVL
jgi:hypothetical protein